VLSAGTPPCGHESRLNRGINGHSHGGYTLSLLQLTQLDRAVPAAYDGRMNWPWSYPTKSPEQMRDEAHKQLLGEMERSAQLSEQYDDVLGQIQGAPNPSTQRSALKKRKQHLRRERAVTEANMAALENTIESAINADLLSEKYEEMSDELLVALVYQPYRSTQPNVSGAANAELDRRHSAMMKKSSTMTTILSVIAILIAVLALLIAVLALLITAFS
jgi:hypothetical protein